MILYNTKTQGILDYLMGIALFVLPAMLQIDRHSVESMILYSMGIILLLYAAFCNFEVGIGEPDFTDADFNRDYAQNNSHLLY